MKLLWFIDFRAFVLDDEIHLQGSQELFRGHAIKILHHTVVVENRQL